MSDAPSHHPPEAMLLDYVSGGCSWQHAVLIQTHLSLCPQCRRLAAGLEHAAASLLLEEAHEPAAAPLPQAEARFDRLISAIETGSRPAPQRRIPGDPRLPPVLRALLPGGRPDRLWRWAWPGLRRIALSDGRDGIWLRLLKISPGSAMPRHRHGAEEFTLVLAGGFTDEFGSFGVGDLAVTDPSDLHQPVADPEEDCIVLTLETAPPKLVLFGGWRRLPEPPMRNPAE